MSKPSTTFAVSSVDSPKPDEGITSTTVQLSVEQILGSKVESCSGPSESVIQPYGFHTVIETVHRSFAEHRPLTLSPDHIWLTVSQGFAACVNADPERYRKCFVSHEGQEEIRIRRDEFRMGNFDNNWRGCFPEFSSAIRNYIGDETHGLILSDFSTTGDIERATSEVVLMDAVQAYFKYVVETRCGIPAITLEGTVEDWKKVLNKTRALAKFGGLEWWLDKATAVVQEFRLAAEGDVNLSFWKHFYKAEDGSGSLTADGHILCLLPFTKDWYGKPVQNPMLRNGSGGLNTSQLPQALSCVPFIWEYFGKSYDYQFLAGHVGIGRDTETGALRPVVGWAVRPKPATK